jgi:hypothetical protein
MHHRRAKIGRSQPWMAQLVSYAPETGDTGLYYTEGAWDPADADSSIEYRYQVVLGGKV